MKKTPAFKITLILMVLALLAGTALAVQQQQLDKDQVLLRILAQSLETYHYSPQQVNDKLSQRIYTLFTKNLDPNKRFLLKSDLQELQQYEFKLDEQIKLGSTDFFDRSIRIFKQRIQENQTVAQDILKKPFDFSENESFEIDPSKRDYSVGKDEQKELWRKLLKYQTLLSYLDLVKEKETNGKKPSKTPVQSQAFQPQLEVKARATVAKNIQRSLTRMLQVKPEDQISLYLNAIAGSFDPHTEYFPPQQKEDFDISFTGTLEGIGAVLREDGEYITVDDVVPGGAAWRQKGLQKGDYILKVAEGKGEPVDIVNMPVTDAVKLIRGKKGTEVKLTVKKPDGRIVLIPIVRDVVVIEESYAKSVVITNQKSKQKFGYILLPSFYHDYKSGTKHNAADDVKKELAKLKAQKVSGIILDLRNNGGGALEDAVEMSGLFIKSGPIVQVKDSVGRDEILRDPDPGIDFNGPLVILINSFSASASEIFAAALQDYGRAVVVGTPQSFGKGSVQQFFELDNMLTREYDYVKPSGSLKLTLGKFYRINGGSTQSKGVVSDIVLPEISSYLDISENKMDYPMPWDTVGALDYQKWGFPINIASLKQKSAQRVQTSKAFQLINENIAVVKEQRATTVESLKLSKMQERQLVLKQETDKLTNLIPANPNLKVSGVDSTKKLDKAQLSKINEWHKQVGKDAYIGEAMNILTDMMGQK